MGRTCELRDGKCDAETLKFLAKRFKSELACKGTDFSKWADEVHLYPGRTAVRIHNIQKLKDMGQPVVRFSAQYTKENSARARQVKAEDAFGCEDKLLLAVGSRVRLTVNLATEAGLVNGAMGYVRDLVWKGDQPLFVLVEFDVYTGDKFFNVPNDNPLSRCVPITVFDADLDHNLGKRIQFPLRLAWVSGSNTVYVFF